jgi:16S rRNA (uracil1498-N3)-methyltransferase
MRLHRFYIKNTQGTLSSGKKLRIYDEALIHQWKNVFRLKSSDAVILFDGSGFDYFANILLVSKDGVEVEIGEKKVGIVPTRKVWLFVSILKKDNFEWVVEKATEIGVSHIVPVESARTEKKSLNMERLFSIAREASEQSGRTDVPEIHEPVSLEDSFGLVSDLPKEALFVADMGGESISSLCGDKDIAIYIGPEGGWSDADREVFAAKDFKAVSLGNTVLRAETAAIVVSALSIVPPRN